MSFPHESSKIIIFGATGDLAKRKLIPALYRLYTRHSIPHNTPIICLGRKDYTTPQYIASLETEKFITDAHENILRDFYGLLNYYQTTFDPKSCSMLRQFLEQTKKKYNAGDNNIFYLATPADLFDDAVNTIHECGLLDGKGWKRIVFEKPFGEDLKSARKLNKLITKHFKEEEIYRIDHYLAKELVRNIIVFRFANSIFEQIWHSKFIDHVQITLSETIGVESRANYYDKSGAIKDMFQNHLLQVLSLVAMESPKTISSEDVRDEQIKIFKALETITKGNVAIGQYAKGIVDGKQVADYRHENNIPRDSKTETYVAAKLKIKNKRWNNVPFYVRTGKRLSASYAEINLILKDVSCNLFCGEDDHDHVHDRKGPNIITIRIQPDEGIVIHFNAKTPGRGIEELHHAHMKFSHKTTFGINTPEAYEVLFDDLFRGDQTLFTRWDAVEQTWKLTDELIKTVKGLRKNFPNYVAGLDGPDEANQMIKKDKREWLNSDIK